MPFAINFRSNNESSDNIRRLWAQCATLEESPSMEAMQYPPHLTLAIYDEVERDNLFAGLAAVVDCLNCLTIRFESLGYFRAPYGIVLWALPVLPQAVLDAHAKIHSTINPDLCRFNYRPGNWVPHCSLATAISNEREDDAIAIAESPIDPFEVTFDAVDCASFMPVEVLRETVFTG
jgi:2'-5' RNA ligase